MERSILRSTTVQSAPLFNAAQMLNQNVIINFDEHFNMIITEPSTGLYGSIVHKAWKEIEGLRVFMICDIFIKILIESLATLKFELYLIFCSNGSELICK